MRSLRILKKIAIGKPIYLALVWTLVTTFIPVIIADAKGRTDIYLFITGRFFFIFAICILFDFRDPNDDQADGTRSMITYFSEKCVTLVFSLSIILFGIMTIWMLQSGYSLLYFLILLLPDLILASSIN